MSPPLLLTAIANFGKTYGELAELQRPANADQPEAVPHVFFDTQLYAQAGSATLTFHKSTAANLADPTLANFASGQLPAYEYFEVHRSFLLFHCVPTLNVTAVITGAAADIEILHKTARGILSYQLKGKPYGGFPVWFFGRPGGPVPIYSSFGTGTAANNTITAGETEANGGFPFKGNIIIPPAVQFSATMQFNSTAISAATYITHAMMGIWHRQVS